MQYWLINYDATCPSGWFTYTGTSHRLLHQQQCEHGAGGTVTAKELAVREALRERRHVGR